MSFSTVSFYHLILSHFVYHYFIYHLKSHTILSHFTYILASPHFSSSYLISHFMFSHITSCNFILSFLFLDFTGDSESVYSEPTFHASPYGPWLSVNNKYKTSSFTDWFKKKMFVNYKFENQALLELQPSTGGTTLHR